MKGDNWDNYAIARETLHEELGRNSEQREPYHLDEKTRDTLIVHARQDAAHALLNTISIIKIIKHITKLIYLLVAVMIAAIIALIAWLS